MKIQPSAGIVYSDTDAAPGSYWWQGAALVSAVLPRPMLGLARPMRVLMIGSCGWAIAAAYSRIGGPDAAWYGLEPDDAMRVAGHTVAVRERLANVKGAWKTPDDVLNAQPYPFDAVIVDAYVNAKPVARWQSAHEVRAAFRLAHGAPIVIHGDVAPLSDKWKVVRA